MNRFLHTPLALTIRRIALLYVVLMLCRVVFLFYNLSQLGTFVWSDLGPLLVGALQFDTASIIYANGVFIILSLLPFHFRERRWYQSLLFWCYTLVNTVLLIAPNLADTLYFRYTQKRFTADEIFFADNDNSLQLVGQFFTENWYLGLIAAGLIVLLMGGYGRHLQWESILRGWAYYVINTLIFAAVTGLCVAGMRGGFTRATRPITLSNATLYTADSGKANLILSNPFCILRTIGSAGTVKYKKYFTPEQLPHHFTPEHYPADSISRCSMPLDSMTTQAIAPDTTAVNLAGHNVMIFILESMSAEHSAHLMPEIYADKPIKGFTPFLDSLMRNGLTFRQMYANGTRSIQAMPSVLGSIPSFKTPFVLMPQSLGQSRQLPAILAEEGYSTAFFCGSERGSMGFGAYARSAGVERLVSREDYESAHGTGDFDGYWGIWDEPFLQFTGEELAHMPEPFFATFFTLSAHHPFVVPKQYASTLPKGYTKIHQGIAYDDQAFRLFFERFGREEWFRRTLFVFVADHVSSEKFASETHVYPGNSHILGFMYTPNGTLRGEIGEVTQQLDIMPTLLGLLGNRKPYFAFGRDVLHEPQRPQWAIGYDGGFRALTNHSILRFDDNTATTTPRTPSATTDLDAERLLQDFQALVQQYYTRVEQKSYTVHD